MDIRKIKKLIELLEESNLSEMEIQEGEESIRLSRSAPIAAAPIIQHAPAVAASVASAPVETVNVTEEVDAINSPMVGTYYSAAKPGDPDFVKVGDTVAVGDVLCIIEAMKIFNQIESDRTGKVVSILKASGDPVEYGEPLFVVQ